MVPRAVVSRLETQESRGVSSSPSLCPKAGRDQCPSLKKSVREKSLLPRLFALFRSSTAWVMATHIKEGNLLYS